MSVTRKLARWIENYDTKGSLGSRLRAKRVKPLLQMIEETFARKGGVSIIDVGGTAKYWNIVSRQYLISRNVTIKILNVGDSHDAALDRGTKGPFSFATGDGCNLREYGDGVFDIAHSNSVLEHVGDWARMDEFAHELARVSRHYFVQTPNYWFPIEPHCMVPLFHWLPKPTRVWLCLHFQLGHWRKANSVSEAVQIVESARLMNKRMLQGLFREATILTERVFGLSKSFVAVGK